jgi:hypothetical protein
MLGPEAATQLLFKDALQKAGGSEADEDNGLESLRHALGTLADEMAEMRDRVEGLIVTELEKQDAFMLQMLADMRTPGSPRPPARQSNCPQSDEPA